MEGRSCSGLSKRTSLPTASREPAKLIQADFPRFDLEHEPNPPALFARLRQYSLLATERARVFDALRTHFPTLVLRPNTSSSGKGKENPAADEDAAGEANTSTLTFASAACVLLLSPSLSLPNIPPSRSSITLQLSYALTSSSHDALAPTLSLSPLLGSTMRAALQASSLAVLDEVQPMFARLLADGRGVEAVVVMLLQSVLGEEA